MAKKECKCGCGYPLTDYDMKKWHGFRRGHEALP